MLRFNYDISGRAAGDQTWQTTGMVTVDDPGQFRRALDLAQQEAFMQLTKGRAVFGQPGVGCRGPYLITRFLLEVAPRG